MIFTSPRRDLVNGVLDPAFDIDDVYMEPTDFDVLATQEIVPRGDLDDINGFVNVLSSQHGVHISPLALPSSTNEARGIFGVGMSNV